MFARENVRNEQVNVTTASSVVVNSRLGQQARKAIIIRNTSSAAADIITLALGSDAAVALNGIVLHMNETWCDSSETGYLCHQDFISAICATANGKLSIMEK